MVSLPRKLELRLPELGISAANIHFVFEASGAADGTTGESWLLIVSRRGNKRSLQVLSAPLLGAIESVGEVDLDEIDSIHAEITFFHNLKLSVRGPGGQPLLTAEIPGLQKSAWPALLQNLETWTAQSVELKEEAYDLTDSGPLINKSALFSPLPSTLSDPLPLQFDPIKVAPDIDRTFNKLQISDVKVAGGSIRIDSVQQNSEFYPQNGGSLPAADITPASIPTPELILTTPPQQALEPPPVQGKFKSKKSPAKPAKKPSESEMVHCKKCGQKNKAEYIYCLGCGTHMRDPNNKKARPIPFAGIKASGIQGSSTAPDSDSTGCGGCLWQILSIIFFTFAILALLILFGK